MVLVLTARRLPPRSVALIRQAPLPRLLALGRVGDAPVDEVRSRLSELPRDRELAVYCQVGQRGYLATRIERSYAAVRRAVELLDTEALRLGRPVTRALAAELLRGA